MRQGERRPAGRCGAAGGRAGRRRRFSSGRRRRWAARGRRGRRLNRIRGGVEGLRIHRAASGENLPIETPSRTLPAIASREAQPSFPSGQVVLLRRTVGVSPAGSDNATGPALGKTAQARARPLPGTGACPPMQTHGLENILYQPDAGVECRATRRAVFSSLAEPGRVVKGAVSIGICGRRAGYVGGARDTPFSEARLDAWYGKDFLQGAVSAGLSGQ